MRINGTIYLDYQASTPIDPVVLSAMEQSWREDFANPHSAEHFLGWRASSALEAAAERIAARFQLGSDHIVFTSGATEANWLALYGCAVGRNARLIEKIIISAAEHKSVRAAAETAASQADAALDVLDIDRAGRVDPQRLREAVGDKPALVSIIAVGNETGAINDITALRAACGDRAILHVDASQAPAAIELESLVPHADLITLSSHKAYGPKGVGALIVSPEMRTAMQPLMPGGSQQGGIRPGTVPTSLVVGFANAIARMAELRSEREVVSMLRDRFVQGLDARVGGVTLVGDPANRHPGNACVRIERVEAADLLSAIQPKIAASTQSACTSGTTEPSEVLMAMGLDLEAARECVRFSLGRFTDASQIDDAIEIVAQSVSDRRSLQSRLVG
jgi:cysteine desulfurase